MNVLYSVHISLNPITYLLLENITAQLHFPIFVYRIFMFFFSSSGCLWDLNHCINPLAKPIRHFESIQLYLMLAPLLNLRVCGLGWIAVTESGSTHTTTIIYSRTYERTLVRSINSLLPNWMIAGKMLQHSNEECFNPEHVTWARIAARIQKQHKFRSLSRFYSPTKSISHNLISNKNPNYTVSLFLQFA